MKQYRMDGFKIHIRDRDKDDPAPDVITVTTGCTTESVTCALRVDCYYSTEEEPQQHHVHGALMLSDSALVSLRDSINEHLTKRG